VGEAAVINLNDELREKFIEVTNGYLSLCFQCGTCTSICPWSLVRDFNVRKYLRSAQLGVEDALNDDVWLCTTCSQCFTTCPKGVKVIDVVKGLRGIVVEKGQVPQTARDVLMSIYRQGNPWISDRGDRALWAEGLDLKLFSKDKADVLFYLCCTSCYDPRNKKVSKALAEIFKTASVDFGILGPEENCCGDAALNLGEHGLFQYLVENNVKLFDKYDIKKVVTSSPHAFNAFKNEYTGLKEDMMIWHHTQYLKDLIENNKLKFGKKLDVKVTYHDPCYLGRHNDIYEEPRMILESIPGVELIEMERVKKNSLCCGGGGGRMFLETPVDERFSGLRVKEALETKADYLVTSCPYCISTLEDSVKALEANIKVIDISELVKLAL